MTTPSYRTQSAGRSTRSSPRQQDRGPVGQTSDSETITIDDIPDADYFNDAYFHNSINAQNDLQMPEVSIAGNSYVQSFFNGVDGNSRLPEREEGNADEYEHEEGNADPFKDVFATMELIRVEDLDNGDNMVNRNFDDSMTSSLAPAIRSTPGLSAFPGNNLPPQLSNVYTGTVDYPDPTSAYLTAPYYTQSNHNQDFNTSAHIDPRLFEPPAIGLQQNTDHHNIDLSIYPQQTIPMGNVNSIFYPQHTMPMGNQQMQDLGMALPLANNVQPGFGSNRKHITPDSDIDDSPRPRKRRNSSVSEGSSLGRPVRNTIIRAGEKPQKCEEKSWVRINNSTKGQTTRTARINHFAAEGTGYRVKPLPHGNWETKKFKFEYSHHNDMDEFRLHTMSAHQIYEYITKFPGPELRLWIQVTPGDSARRYASQSHSECIFKNCPNRTYASKGTIEVGNYRVAFDEKHKTYGKGKVDPFDCVSFAHLYCMERFLDFAEICRIADVKVDARGEMSKEPKGEPRFIFSAKHSADRELAEKFLKVARRDQLHQTPEFWAYPDHADYKDTKEKIHENTLNYAMHQAYWKSRTPSQIKQFLARVLKPGFAAIHRGNLEIINVHKRIEQHQDFKRARKQDKHKSFDYAKYYHLYNPEINDRIEECEALRAKFAAEGQSSKRSYTRKRKAATYDDEDDEDDVPYRRHGRNTYIASASSDGKGYAAYKKRKAQYGERSVTPPGSTRWSRGSRSRVVEPEDSSDEEVRAPRQASSKKRRVVEDSDDEDVAPPRQTSSKKRGITEVDEYETQHHQTTSRSSPRKKARVNYAEEAQETQRAESLESFSELTHALPQSRNAPQQAQQVFQAPSHSQPVSSQTSYFPGHDIDNNWAAHNYRVREPDSPDVSPRTRRAYQTRNALAAHPSSAPGPQKSHWPSPKAVTVKPEPASPGATTAIPALADSPTQAAALAQDAVDLGFDPSAFYNMQHYTYSSSELDREFNALDQLERRRSSVLSAADMADLLQSPQMVTRSQMAMGLKGRPGAASAITAGTGVSEPRSATFMAQPVSEKREFRAEDPPSEVGVAVLEAISPSVEKARRSRRLALRKAAGVLKTEKKRRRKGKAV
ncbi:hypothetical protein IQ07DRAFT_651045 [Pyrenochaeta sp. DS3sAY3a]|nr:hypothetical protein IQ07DRAFT_651045 [Pyrenochaeta sp. DS3sAY3a]